QFNNMNESQRDWSNLAFTTTDETTKGRDLTAGTQISLENAMSQFDKIHARQLQYIQSTNYTGLTSVTTDEQGRNRTTMIAQATDQSLIKSEDIVSQLSKINAAYANLQTLETTNEQASDRQAQIEKTWNAMEAQATALVNDITKIDTNYLNLQSGGTTNENTVGRQLDAAHADSLNKAIQIFQEIHAKKLTEIQSTQYAGLTSTTTDEQNSNDRNASIASASQQALQNALNIYNSYYPSNGLNQTRYSH
ncbi:MAG: hypothetical protein KGI08_09895, partial [Thaumarchaeota archaeon]|nr:hypothetical protein [Nitrososphaerota archaeon]